MCLHRFKCEVVVLCLKCVKINFFISSCVSVMVKSSPAYVRQPAVSGIMLCRCVMMKDECKYICSDRVCV